MTSVTKPPGTRSRERGQEREGIQREFVRKVGERLADNKRVRRQLPGRGRLHIDRPLPFLCVYRKPLEVADKGTELLVTTEASYLQASADPMIHSGLSRLVSRITDFIAREYGAVLLLEVWATRPKGESAVAPADAAEALRPRFTIHTPRFLDPGPFVYRLEEVLSRIVIRGRSAEVEVAPSRTGAPPGLRPILSRASLQQQGGLWLGLEVRPIYRDPKTGEVFPIVLRVLRRLLSRALRRAFFEFVRTRTTHQPEHYHVLGRRAVVKAVWEVDRRLAEVSDRFDFLLQVTPVNSEQAWHQFQRHRFDRTPTFHYRPLPVDPGELKRDLYDAPVERLEDPALALLFRQKQDELDRQITMLVDLNTSRFVHGSVQVFGGADEGLLTMAHDLLNEIPPRTREDSGKGYLDAAAFAALARQEIEHYREAWPELKAGVELREDTAPGLMVSRGALLIGSGSRIPAPRAHALLQHEIGTHLVTYVNGRAQPFRQLYSGLAGYEATQEGLAVTAEYLAGGLSRPRLRLLGARALSVDSLLGGATFVDAFRRLVDNHGFEKRMAYGVVMRVYRGGGLTKDAVYLGGLAKVLEYLGRGGKLEPLLVGKISVDHVQIVRELTYRGILREPPLKPRYLTEPDAAARLAELRKGRTVLDLARPAAKAAARHAGGRGKSRRAG